jgi:hypothetical protein
MNDVSEMLGEYLHITKNIPQEILEAAYMTERIRFFCKLRSLIHEKDFANDDIAAEVLGWAYEKLAN